MQVMRQIGCVALRILRAQFTARFGTEISDDRHPVHAQFRGRAKICRDHRTRLRLRGAFEDAIGIALVKRAAA